MHEPQRDWSRGMALNQPNDAIEGTLAAVLIREQNALAVHRRANVAKLHRGVAWARGVHRGNFH